MCDMYHSFSKLKNKQFLLTFPKKLLTNQMKGIFTDD